MILLDTCVFLWLNQDPPPLPFAILDRIRKTPSGSRFVSAVSALEIGVKARRGRLELPAGDPKQWFDSVVAERGINVIPMTVPIAFRSAALPELHRDSADRLIIATALEHRLVLLTPDRLIAQYPEVELAWR